MGWLGKNAPVHRIHGSLLAVGELLRSNPKTIRRTMRVKRSHPLLLKIAPSYRHSTECISTSFTTRRRGSADVEMRRQMLDLHWKRLCRRRNRHQVVKGIPNARTRRHRQSVTVDALFANMVNTSVVENYRHLLMASQIPYYRCRQVRDVSSVI
uniref:Uncharacterized protein n=1 Tax=Cucumis melo TaxID=3656 RepID=A0A9I9E6E5_CUCME